MLGLILGVFTILLGVKAFSKDGIPLTRNKNLKGTAGTVIGIVCILLGLLFLADGVLASFNLFALITGR